MIYRVLPFGQHSDLDLYLMQFESNLLGRVRTLNYQEIAAGGRLPIGSYIFCALDQASPAELAMAQECWNLLEEKGLPLQLINRPSEQLHRYALLRECARLGRNSFRVGRLSALPHWNHFPAFIRDGRLHGSMNTKLLNTRWKLACNLLWMGKMMVIARFSLRDFLIMEFCDTRDGQGVYRKYSAYIVGNRIIPYSLIHSRNWAVRDSNSLWFSEARQSASEETMASEELDYVRDDPHAQWLRETFALARIGFGRIDYSVRDGVCEVWEINTHPTIAWPEGWPGTKPDVVRMWDLRKPAHMIFLRQFEDAMHAVDCPIPEGESLPFDGSLWAKPLEKGGTPTFVQRSAK
jgi:hypothetical protein